MCMYNFNYAYIFNVCLIPNAIDFYIRDYTSGLPGGLGINDRLVLMYMRYGKNCMLILWVHLLFLIAILMDCVYKVCNVRLCMNY